VLLTTSCPLPVRQFKRERHKEKESGAGRLREGLREIAQRYVPERRHPAPRQRASPSTPDWDPRSCRPPGRGRASRPS
jgi:hypothetical protein